MNQPYFSLTPPPINAILTATTDVTGLQKFVWYGHRSQRPFFDCCKGHRVCALVTGSQTILRCSHKVAAKFKQSQIVTPAWLLYKVGVTTLCWLEPLHHIFIKRWGPLAPPGRNLRIVWPITSKERCILDLQSGQSLQTQLQAGSCGNIYFQPACVLFCISTTANLPEVHKMNINSSQGGLIKVGSHGQNSNTNSTTKISSPTSFSSSI